MRKLFFSLQVTMIISSLFLNACISQPKPSHVMINYSKFNQLQENSNEDERNSYNKYIDEISKRSGVSKDKVQRILEEANTSNTANFSAFANVHIGTDIEQISSTLGIRKEIVRQVLNAKKEYTLGKEKSDETGNRGPGRR